MDVYFFPLINISDKEILDPKKTSLLWDVNRKQMRS